MMRAGGSSREASRWRIGEVARVYGVHPQTLRLYERRGLLRPERSRGNDRLYGPGDRKRLEMILGWTREHGINFAGVQGMLRLQARIDRLKVELDELLESSGLKSGPEPVDELSKDVEAAS